MTPPMVSQRGQGRDSTGMRGSHAALERARVVRPRPVLLPPAEVIHPMTRKLIRCISIIRTKTKQFT